ncbi:MAG: CHASE2 domain-containing protein [Crocosphaera sp.]|nr:CHASE2 domain-containing protein [Crocosphaera sp.]
MTKYALIIAIPEYDHFKPLEKTTRDAEAIAQILHQYGDYDITRLPRKGNAETADYEIKAGKVTVAQLYETLKLFFNQITQGQSALVYFTGHGFTCHQFDEEEGFLATSDTQVTRENNKIVEKKKIIAQNKGFPLKRLDSLIQQANLSEFVLLLDCCHSGNFIETHLMQKSLNTFEYRQNYYLITACRSFETAKTIRKEEHSVFSGAIIEGLSDKNKDEKGKISCDHLFDVINRKIGDKLQTPIHMGIGGSITLVKYPLANIEEIPKIEPIRDNNGEIVCPYQGLNVFTSKEKVFFFGRQRLTEDIKQKLENFGVIPIIGASGSGKSSVVYAGVMAWLEAKSQEWCILPTIKPGIDPLTKLRQVFMDYVSLDEVELKEIIEDEERGIRDIVQFLPNSRKYFLFIDQFEEVFTLCSGEKERKRFIDLITQIKVKNEDNFVIITTMRADFLDRCLQYQSLCQIIQHQAIYIPSLEGKYRQDIIIKPAQRQGYQIEHDLLLQLLSDVGKKQGFLPLLEFALTLLWEKRDEDNKMLTLDAYEKLGESETGKQKNKEINKTGLTKALDIYAEKVYNYQYYDRENPQKERTEIEKELIKLIFLRLIRTNNQEQDTRQRQPKEILVNIANEDQEKQEILEKLIYGKQGLVNARLLVTGSDISSNTIHNGWVDLVHEALIEGWQRFKQWREEDRDLLRLSERLEDQRQQWLNHPINENLMMGGLLIQVRQQWEKLQSYLLYPSEAKEFYNQSDEYEKAKIKELEDAKMKQIEAEKSYSSWKKASEIFIKAQKEAKQQKPHIKAFRLKQSVLSIIGSVAITTLCLLTVRQFGWLQWSALASYDYMTRIASHHSPDPRLLIVGITEQDIQQFSIWPISDETIAQVLETIQTHQPAVIGLSIYRDIPHPPGTKKLSEVFKADNIITLKALPSGNQRGTPAPPNIPSSRVGYADVLIDFDNVVRRSYLYLQSSSGKIREYSFALQVSLQYLKLQKKLENFVVNPDSLKINSTIFPRLVQTSGGYKLPESEASGWQVLVRYRSQKIAQQISFQDVLTKNFESKSIKDKIVLIGVFAPSTQDSFPTPYTARAIENFQMFGIELHGTIISQILSTVLDGENLLVPLPDYIEWILIISWGFIGAIMPWYYWYFKNFLWFAYTILWIGLLLTIAYFIFFTFGWWLPLVPSLLMFFSTTIVTYFLNKDLIEKFYAKESLIKILKKYQDNLLEAKIAVGLWIDSLPKNCTLILYEIIVPILQQCQTTIDIAKIYKKLAWIPQPIPVVFYPSLSVFLDVSESIDDSIKKFLISREPINIKASINVLENIDQTFDENSKFQYRTEFTKIAKAWIIILNNSDKRLG